mgnify:CR=1 FL=1
MVNTEICSNENFVSAMDEIQRKDSIQEIAKDSTSILIIGASKMHLLRYHNVELMDMHYNALAHQIRG